MKKRLKIVGLILLLLTAYSVAAAVLLRGLGAYQLGTQVGKLLAVSRPYTMAAAAVGWMITAVCVLLWARRKKRASAQENQPRIAPTVGVGETTPDEEPAQAQPKIAPAAPMPAPEEPAPASAAPTELMPEPEEPAPACAAPTELMPAPEEPAPACAAPTELMPAPEEPAPAHAVCPSCGRVFPAGQKFCTQCGARIGGAV